MILEQKGIESKYSEWNSEVLARVDEHNMWKEKNKATYSPLKAWIEQLPPTIATGDAESPNLPTVITFTPSGTSLKNISAFVAVVNEIPRFWLVRMNIICERKGIEWKVNIVNEIPRFWLVWMNITRKGIEWKENIVNEILRFWLVRIVRGKDLGGK